MQPVWTRAGGQIVSRNATTGIVIAPLRHRVKRVQRGVRRHGPAGSVRLALERLRKRFHLVEAHVWYQIEMNGSRPRLRMAEGFRLVRAGEEDLGIVEEFGPIGRADAERRHSDGATLWYLRDEEGRPAFSCWTFPERLPVVAAKGGSLSLREGTVALEDSYTAPEHRGHRLGPGACSAVIDCLAEEGVDFLITKIEEDNEPARMAAPKVGFDEVATMRTSRILWFRPRVEVSVLGDGEGPFLDRQLSSVASG
jgi:RimJ/RimL family protein N-acetyltransferase